jgi:hypothetical protein
MAPATASSTAPASAAAPTVATPSYFFLYDKPFLGLAPPLAFIVFCLGSLLTYLALVFFIWPATRPTTERAVLFWARMRDIHNVALCVFSGVCVVVTVLEMIDVGVWWQFLEFFYTLDVSKLDGMLCLPLSEKWQMPLLVRVFAWSKLPEMLDTMYLVYLSNSEAKAILKAASGSGKNTAATATGATVARASAASAASANTRGSVAAGADAKKFKATDSGISVLGVYHHATTFWLFLLVTNFYGAARCGTLLNGFVHFAMYWHFARPWPKPLVPFITAAQMAQLAFVTYAWSITPSRCPQYAAWGSTAHKLEFWTPYFMVPVFLLLFARFFVEKFIFKSKKATE